MVQQEQVIKARKDVYFEDDEVNPINLFSNLNEK
jgi:hypothetical protein